MKVTHRMQWVRPIMIIEDDMDDQELLRETFCGLDYPNPVIFFSDGNEALNYLRQTSAPPVLIISDINMPKINGFEIRRIINTTPELRKLNMPFVFLSTLSQKDAGADAYFATDHGFFTKPYSMADLRNTIKSIVEYWVHRHTPALYVRSTEQGNYLIR